MAKLVEIADRPTTITFGDLPGDTALVREIQERLSDLGLLDPPVDGTFGPVSRWAFADFMQRVGHDVGQGLNRDLAAKLLQAKADDLFPIRKSADLAGRLVAAVQAHGHWLCRHPDAVNIVYAEGMGPDGVLTDNRPNRFNDLRVVLRIGPNAQPEILGRWDGTTEPGRKWTVAPMNPSGAARIEFGQYKAWGVGMHHAGSPGAHEALVQTAPITVYRDLNKDFSRQGDTKETGVFAINQHWGYDLPPDDLGGSSAGCLVGRTKSGHREFMKLVKQDARYRTSQNYRFMTAVLDGQTVPA